MDDYMEQLRCCYINTSFNFIFIVKYLKSVTHFMRKLVWILAPYSGQLVIGFFKKQKVFKDPIHIQCGAILLH